MTYVAAIAVGAVGGWAVRRLGAWMAMRVDWSWLVTEAPSDC